MFDFDSQKWTEVASLLSNRYLFATTVYFNAIYVVGGRRGVAEKRSDKIEIFETEIWSLLPFSLSVKIDSPSLWSYDNGKYLLFGGMLDGGDHYAIFQNTKMYSFDLNKYKCDAVSYERELLGNYTDRHHGRKDNIC